jgi:hypothetical protein
VGRTITVFFGARVLEIDLRPKHLELCRHSCRAAIARVVDVGLLRLHVRANDAHLFHRKQQLVVRANGVEGRFLPRPLYLVFSGTARNASRLERLAELEAENRLPDVGRCRKGVARQRPQRIAELRREFVEVRAVQQTRIARPHGERVPRDVGERVGFRFDDAAFENGDLLEAQLHGGIGRQRLGYGVSPRKRLRGCDAGE